MTPMTPSRRALRLGAVPLIAGGLVLTTCLSPAVAATATSSARPVRTITGSSSVPSVAIANDGTIYDANDDISVWAPDSDGKPDVVKTFTGTTTDTTPSLLEGVGLAYISSDTEVQVLNPSQASGAAVPIRTISGANTKITEAAAVAWTPSGSLWVANDDTTAGIQLLRFAPGATGNVAPVQVIGGAKTGLDDGITTTIPIAGLPGNAVAASPPGLDPQVDVFSASQTGNVAPVRHLSVPTPGPHWLSEGVGSDAAGNIYIGSGDINGDSFGRLDVFGPTGSTPRLTLGGSAQRFQVPVLPTASANGTLALEDVIILSATASTTLAKTEVFRNLLTLASAPLAVAVKKTSKTDTVSWKAPLSAGGTTITSYSVVIKKGSKTVLKKAVAGSSLSVKRKSLPKGSLKVTVSAVNGGGSGAAASKSFTN